MKAAAGWCKQDPDISYGNNSDDQTGDYVRSDIRIRIYIQSIRPCMGYDERTDRSISTELVSTYAYRLSFEEFQFSKGAAAANILFLILLVVGVFYIKLINEEEEIM